MYFAFQKLGQEIPRAEIKKMIASHDLKHDGMLDFGEFKALFLGNEKEQPFGKDGPAL